MSSLQLDPDRALPFPTEQRSIAREIYDETKDLPLICMHGHVEPEAFADDLPFANPAQLLIVPDHSGCWPPRALSPLASGCHDSMGARSRLTHGRSGIRSARAGRSSAAHPRGTGWNTSSSRYSGSIWSRRHSHSDRIHPCPTTNAGPVRHRPKVSRHPLHGRRDLLQPRTSTDRRYISFGSTGRPMVVPRFP
jgi:hypothetical protein